MLLLAFAFFLEFGLVLPIPCCFDNMDIFGQDILSHIIDNVPSIETCVEHCVLHTPGCQRVVWLKEGIKRLIVTQNHGYRKTVSVQIN